MIRPPLSLYVHLPWCAQKCPYCDFNSHTGGTPAARRRYLDALLLDLEAEASLAAGREIQTVFLGGGTPSLFLPDEIAELLEVVRVRLDVSADAEITMEANPGTVESGEPAGYRDAGINRLSLGGQSFNDEHLKRLGRIHSSDDILKAVDDARRAGIENVNIDLMHGLPGQGVAEALQDIRVAARLEPAHISWYQLTLERNTVFFACPPEGMPDDDTAHEIQERGLALLDEKGFTQYEVSAYARENRVCRHNLNYWLFGDYLAIGAGAHGKISDSRGVFRYVKPANPLQYMGTMEADPYRTEQTLVGKDDLVFEFMLNALRLTDGFSESVFCERTGRSAGELAEAMQSASEKGLIAREDNAVWRPTLFGKRFLNDLQAEFLVESR